MWDKPIPLNHYKVEIKGLKPIDLTKELSEEQVDLWAKEAAIHLKNRGQNAWITHQFSSLEDIAKQLGENAIRQTELKELSYALMHHGHKSMLFVDNFLKNSPLRTIFSPLRTILFFGYSSRRSDYVDEFLKKAREEARQTYNKDNNKIVNYREAALNFLIAARIDHDIYHENPWPQYEMKQKRELFEAWQKSKEVIEDKIMLYHLGSKKILRELKKLTNYDIVAKAILELHWDDVNAHRIYKQFTRTDAYKQIEKESGGKNVDKEELTRRIGSELSCFDIEWHDLYPTNLALRLPPHTQRVVNIIALEFNGSEESIIMKAADDTPECIQHTPSERLRLSRDYKCDWLKKSK